MGGGPSVINKPITTDSLLQCVVRGELDLFKETYNNIRQIEGKERVIDYKDTKLNRNSLMICCVLGNTEILSLLINAKASLNELDDEGHTALMLAACNNYPEIVQLLLSAGADTNIQTTSNGETALIIAANNNYANIVKLLVDANADLTLCTKGGNNAFVIAIWNGYLECAKYLYKEELLYIQDNDGTLPLMHACQNGHNDIVRWLRKPNINLDTVNNKGNSAIFYAAQFGKLDCIQILLKGLKGKAKANVNLRNTYGNTCIYRAIENGHLKVVQALVLGHININNKNNNGLTPLMLAASVGKLDIMKYLIDRKADINDKDNKGETALMKCAFKNHLVCLKVLLTTGASVNIKDNVGMMAIHHACISGAKNTLKALIDKSIITIDERDNGGNTPMMIAAINGHSRTTSILIQERAILNSVNKRGETALILASKLGRSKVVDVLLKAGADPLKVDVDELGALNYSKKEKIREALLSKISTLRTENDGNNHNNGDNDSKDYDTLDNDSLDNDSFDAFDGTIEGSTIILDTNEEDFDNLNKDEEKMANE